MAVSSPRRGRADFSPWPGAAASMSCGGAEGAPLVVNLPGTPQGHVLFPSVEKAAALAGIQIVSLARRAMQRVIQEAEALLQAAQLLLPTLSIF